MEKTLNSNDDKEFMRMAMLKHEETFREQVNELHRLYRIQKMLMESVGVNQQQKQKLERYNLVESSKKPFTIDHYQQQLILQAQVQAQRDIINRSKSNNIIMGLNVIRPDNQVLTRGDPRPSDAQEHIAESSNGNDKIRELDDPDIELTLSLGPSSFNPTRRKNGKSESGQSISSSSTGSSQTKKTSPKNNNNVTRSSTTTWGGFPSGSGIEPGFSNGQQNGSNPPWLYQALSLKLT
ncbi:hypothetical protein BVRB_6g127910 [Beta vulgaris subsp. vulgaris]|uniref:uncharacterized protein LOC104894929 n=1 Tax=Beta vulgaris subsp. vulgaris TaxID=3555 RepID=UPI00053F659F|nr:uncharacterized protein LOC104894929 [Beta vulgaris subsp. vulgaris]XP_048502190.1 uncharacterized protein LOC104894929 [Beta vulgaris subsp. vulgaris]KMT09815.1 hypothetical protein BVRB_6g127910 [Beta vulgaris subsp. vulgaris]